MFRGVFPKHIYVCPSAQARLASNVVNSILTPIYRRPFCVLKNIAICPTTECIVAYQVYALDVPNKQIGSTALHVLESQFSKFQNFPT